MHGGTISDNTAGASDGGGGGVYVGEKCSFTMDGGTITGNTATAGNGGGIYIHFNAGTFRSPTPRSPATRRPPREYKLWPRGRHLFGERGNRRECDDHRKQQTYEGGGIYGKGAITLTDATVTDNTQYDVYYDGQESNNS